MPSNKTPSVVNPGTGLPVASTAAASAIGDALKAHINDPVGAHAGSAISYTAGPNWANGDTNPDADVQVEIDKIITDLATFASSPSGAHHIGAATQAAPFTNAPLDLLADELYSQLSALLLYVNTPYRAVLLDAGTPTYTVSAAPRVTNIFVDTSGGGRLIRLPGGAPADHTGWRWHVIDVTGTSSQYPFNLRPGGPTINGRAGDYPLDKDFGHWIVTCDGTNFYVEEMQAPIQPVVVDAGNSPYTVDSGGIQNDLFFVRTNASRTIIFPPASACNGRVWRIVDTFGASHIFPITLQPNGVDAINSYGGSITVGKYFGEWIVTCDGVDLFVQEMRAPTMQPPVVTTATYNLDGGALQFDDVYVDTTSGARVITLPTFPSSHKDQKWHIYDVTPAASLNSITFDRNGNTINGVAANYVAKTTVGALTTGEMGHWEIICDGTGYWVHEVPARTGGLTWANTWTNANNFSNSNPLRLTSAGNVTVNKTTDGEFRVVFGGTTTRTFSLRETDAFFTATGVPGGASTKYGTMGVGSEGPGTTTPFSGTTNPDSIFQLRRSSDGVPGFEFLYKGGGAAYTRIGSGGWDQAGADRSHLIFDLNNNEGYGECITILPTKSVLLDPGHGWYKLPTNVGGVRSYGRKPQDWSACILEAYILSIGVDELAGPPVVPKPNCRYMEIRRAGGYRDTTTYYVADDTQVFLSDDSGLAMPPPLARIVADTNGFHIEVKSGSDTADWFQLWWGYLKVVTFTFNTSYDETVSP